MTPRTQQPADLGVVGLGVMGRNLALNLADHGYVVAAWDASEVARESLAHADPGSRVHIASDVGDFVLGLRHPRRVLVMVPAGAAVDQVIAVLHPRLSSGDVIIDGGNTRFEDTRRREAELATANLLFVGMGVSGGEEGARHGPSLMPGGTPAAWQLIKPPFEAIAAKSQDGPCITHVGPDGAGHFVKMVHNGIEYGDMQLLAEAYDLMRRGLCLSANSIRDQFITMNQGPLASFLVELTAALMAKVDARTGRTLVELVADQAQQKGTGRWTIEAALALGVPIPTITAAVDARAASADASLRVRMSTWLTSEALDVNVERDTVMQDLHQALLVGKICAYAQGFALIGEAARHYAWPIELAEIARIWKAGCIIRARLLDSIETGYRREPALPHLFFSAPMAAALNAAIPGLRRIVAWAACKGLPVPALSASLAYIDSLRSAQLPQNLIQAQRDAFGAHTYVRADDLDGEPQHTEWLKPDD